MKKILSVALLLVMLMGTDAVHATTIKLVATVETDYAIGKFFYPSKGKLIEVTGELKEKHPTTGHKYTVSLYASNIGNVTEVACVGKPDTGYKFTKGKFTAYVSGSKYTQTAWMAP